MELAFQIIVIMLSVMLALFLGIAIASTMLVFKLIKELRLIVEKGDQLIDSAGEISNTIKRNAGAASLLKMLLSAVTTINKVKKGRR